MAGAFVISITPFDAGGAIDEAAFRGHLRRLAAAGIGVYVGGGGSGEGFTLSAGETRRLLEIAVDELDGRVPVRAMGVEPRTAGQMVDFLAIAAAAGVEAAQVYSLELGHGHRPTPAEVEDYFTEVLSATDLPVVVSTHQSVGYRAGVDLLGGLVERHAHVIGVNCTHPDLGYLAAVLDAVRGRAAVHVGGPNQAVAALSLGADGYLTSEGNLAPQLCQSVIDHFTAGDLPSLAHAFDRVVRLSRVLYGAGGIRATKAVLAHLGLPGGFPRRPLLPLDEAAVASVVAAVGELGIDLT